MSSPLAATSVAISNGIWGAGQGGGGVKSVLCTWSDAMTREDVKAATTENGWVSEVWERIWKWFFLCKRANGMMHCWKTKMSYTLGGWCAPLLKRLAVTLSCGPVISWFDARAAHLAWLEALHCSSTLCLVDVSMDGSCLWRSWKRRNEISLCQPGTNDDSKLKTPGQKAAQGCRQGASAAIPLIWALSDKTKMHSLADAPSYDRLCNLQTQKSKMSIRPQLNILWLFTSHRGVCKCSPSDKCTSNGHFFDSHWSPCDWASSLPEAPPSCKAQKLWSGWSERNGAAWATAEAAHLGLSVPSPPHATSIASRTKSKQASIASRKKSKQAEKRVQAVTLRECLAQNKCEGRLISCGASVYEHHIISLKHTFATRIFLFKPCPYLWSRTEGTLCSDVTNEARAYICNLYV